jgi:hypothetical protein
MAISCAGNSVPAPTQTPSPISPGPASPTRTPQPPPTLNLSPDFNATPFPVVGGTGLTVEQQSEIGQIVHADPEVAEIAGGTPYDLREFGSWLGEDDPVTGEPTQIGGFVTIAFLRPVPHVEHDFKVRQPRPYYSAWPDDAKAKYGPYAESTEHRSIDNLRRLYAFVDLQKNEVAFFRVFEESGQTVTEAPLVEPTPVITIGPSNEASDIFHKDDLIKPLLEGRTYNDVDQYAIQYTVGEKHLATMNVVFKQPQEIEGDWLIGVEVDYQTFEYTSEIIHFTAPNVSLISVTIDLDRGQVVAIQPSEYHGD